MVVSGDLALPTSADEENGDSSVLPPHRRHQYDPISLLTFLLHFIIFIMIVLPMFGFLSPNVTFGPAQNSTFASAQNTPLVIYSYVHTALLVIFVFTLAEEVSGVYASDTPPGDWQPSGSAG